MQGVLKLRQQLADKVLRLYQAEVDPETEITVTAGATEALFAAIAAVVQTGDEVIIIEPAYDAYAPAVTLNQGVPVYVPLTFPDYRMDWDRLAEAVTSRTRLIILNSPHNPTGTVFKQADIAALQEIVSRHDVNILSDEVYEHIVFDNVSHQSMLRYPDLAQKSFVVGSFGKTYHTTGWKIGYCFAPSPLTAEFRKIHQFLTFAVNTPIQLAYADFIQSSTFHEKLNAFYQEKRDAFLKMMAPSRFVVLPCEGTYFQMMDYSNISDEADEAFARRLTLEHGVAAIPPSVFYHDRRDHHVLRFCFAKQLETLEKAAEKLCRI